MSAAGSRPPGGPLRLLRELAVLPVVVYQRTLSRITPPTCRFRPTCSQYAVEAVRNRGVLEGGLRAAWRLLRCHPFSEGGWDLPPGPRGDDATDPGAPGAGSGGAAPLSCASHETPAPDPCASPSPPCPSPSSPPAPGPPPGPR